MLLLYLQGALVLLGAFLIIKGEVRLGRQTLGPPIASVVGWSLVAPLPICVVLSILFGFAEAASGNFSPNLAELESKYDWVDVTVTVIMLLTAGGLTVIGLKDENADPFAAERNANNPVEAGPRAPDSAMDGLGRSDDSGAFTDRSRTARDAPDWTRERD